MDQNNLLVAYSITSGITGAISVSLIVLLTLWLIVRKKKTPQKLFKVLRTLFDINEIPFLCVVIWFAMLVLCLVFVITTIMAVITAQKASKTADADTTA